MFNSCPANLVEPMDSLVLILVRLTKQKGALVRAPFCLVGGLGFEPRLTESESVVLPLDDPPETKGGNEHD